MGPNYACLFVGYYFLLILLFFTIIYSVKGYMVLPKVIFVWALALFENCIDCDIVQLSMKIYSLSGLWIITCTRNKSQWRKGIWPGTLESIQ